MKLKNLRKMVSVILGVVISCMCFATPVCAAGKSEASVMGTNVPNIGIQRICMYPTIYYDDGSVDYGNPSCSQTFVSGTDFLNLTVNPLVLSTFDQYGCNAWLFHIYFCSDPDVSSIEFKINGQVVSTETATSSDQIVFILADMDYFTYELVYHLRSGGTRSCGGHVNVR